MSKKVKDIPMPSELKEALGVGAFGGHDISDILTRVSAEVHYANNRYTGDAPYVKPNGLEDPNLFEHDGKKYYDLGNGHMREMPTRREVGFAGELMAISEASKDRQFNKQPVEISYTQEVGINFSDIGKTNGQAGVKRGKGR